MNRHATHHYFTLLDRIHRHLLPRTYLEIGVAENKSLALTLPCTRAVGVDPDPRPRHPVDRHTTVVAKTSDDFFATEDKATLFGNLPIDMTFLDGLHHYEFVLRDFMHAERWSAPGSVVLVHDVWPDDERSAARTQSGRHWAGDVWKLLIALGEHRPDLDVRLVPVAPTGMGIITGLDPTSTILAERHDDIVASLAGMAWPPDTSRREIADAMALTVDDWRVIESTLPPPFQSLSDARQRARRALRVPTHLGWVPAEIERRAGLTVIGPLLRRVKAHAPERR